jgi:hypothetical protein
MKVEEIAEVVAKLPPDQLARFRRWFSAFEAGRTDHAEELDSTATKLGRLAGRAFAELKRRAKEPASTAPECRCVTSRAGGSGRPRSQSHSVGKPRTPKMQGLRPATPAEKIGACTRR